MLPEVSAIAAALAGVAASDWARATEKSVVAAAACAVPCADVDVPDVPAFAEPGLGAPEERPVCAPEREGPPVLPESVDPPLPEGFDREEVDLEPPERDAEDRSAGECAGCEPEELALPASWSPVAVSLRVPVPVSLPVPAPEAVDEDELAEPGAAEDAGAEGETRSDERPDRRSEPEAAPPRTESGRLSAAMGDRPSGPELL